MPATNLPQPSSQSITPTPRSKVTIEGDKEKPDNLYAEYMKSYTESSSNRNAMSSYTNQSISNPKDNKEDNQVATTQSLGLGKTDFTYTTPNYEYSYKMTNFSAYNNDGKINQTFDYQKGIGDYSYGTDYKYEGNPNCVGLIKA
jgi:hypothetical protein